MNALAERWAMQLRAPQLSRHDDADAAEAKR